MHLNQSYQPFAYFPNKLSKIAIVTYILALLTCLIVYFQQALDIQWIIFGIVEVLFFFYYANKLSIRWMTYKPNIFIKQTFFVSLIIRIIWVIISYFIYSYWTNTPFIIDAADELFYHELAQYGSNLLKSGNFQLYQKFQEYSGLGLSDAGYPIYLSFIYFIFGDSIIISRLIKTLFSSWTVVLIYKLGARNFGESVGKIAAIFCLLMPNLIYYCSLSLKEVEMVFLTVLFAERADMLFRKKHVSISKLIFILTIPLVMFTIRTSLAITLLLSFICTIVIGRNKILDKKRRAILLILITLISSVVLYYTTGISDDIRYMWETRNSQEQNMEWRSRRGDITGTLNQTFAKYAGASVFAPMIFTLPFPTMTETPGQEDKKMIHGGNYIKNILSFFTIMSLFLLLFKKKWKDHILPISLMVGYLVILIFSNFAHSERFHQPILPFSLLFAAYAIGMIPQEKWLSRLYNYWCILIFVAIIAWNWFKLAGRGMI